VATRRPLDVPADDREEVVAALQLVDGRPWVDAFRHRYLAYERVTAAG
jgi:hypothetical protein